MTGVTMEEGAATSGRMPIRKMAGGKKSQNRLLIYHCKVKGWH